ncbi:MAG: hypothetical protein EPO27_07585 [Betaproteobacteria bacterium]|nr:MAG: hypothetical protein EPO27_07585 [Betaproteobacteria bacterium]
MIAGWAKDRTIGDKLANAMGETAAERPAFRSEFKNWRCQAPVRDFREWILVVGKKQP